MGKLFSSGHITNGSLLFSNKEKGINYPFSALFHKIVKIISFVDLPLRKKFLLFSIGVLFWFVVMFTVNIAASTYINNRTTQMIKTIVPSDKITQKIIRKLQNLRLDASAITSIKSLDALTQKGQSSMATIRDIESFISALLIGGDIADINRNNNQFVEILSLDSNQNLPEAIQYGNTLKPTIESLKAHLQSITQTKRALINGNKQDLAGFSDAFDEYLSLIEKSYTMSTKFSSLFAKLYNQSSDEITRATRLIYYAYSGILLVSSMLLIIFTITITKSIAIPVRSMMDQIKSIAAGKIDLSKQIPVRSRDEIGTLTEDFNNLTKEIFDIVTFKKVIEEDDCLEDVYARLGKSFREKCGLDEFMIYEVTSSNSKMKPVYPIILNEKEISCSEEMLDNCELCKVTKTGHSISSVGYPEICKQFRLEVNKVHLCLPMIVGGKIGGVVQFLFNSDNDVYKDTRKLFKAEQYIKESLSVIEAKRLMDTLKESALKDPLTNLYNRRFLQEYTETLVGGSLRRNKTIGLIMCDLDFFKQVNDLHGHNVGDMVLRETSIIIKNCLRSSDIIIRFGGEEFLVLLLDINEGESFEIAEKIREMVESAKFKIADGSGSIRKTISLGISEFPGDAESFWQAIKFADVALYKAKESGRNQSVRFTEDMWKEESF